MDHIATILGITHGVRDQQDHDTLHRPDGLPAVSAALDAVLFTEGVWIW